MKNNLQSIANRLTESEIQELIRLKKQSDKKVMALQKKRDKMAAQLANLDGQIAKLGGDVEAKPRRRRVAGKTAEKADPIAKPRKKRRRGGANLTSAVREVFTRAGQPLKAREIVDGLPDVGMKVRNIAEMRKSVSVILAQKKNYFEQVERGVYQLKPEE